MKALVLSLLLAPLATAPQPTFDDLDEAPRPSIEEYDLGKKNLALGGYDPVAYFEVGGGEPTKGSKSRETVYRGVRYRFSSKANQELFLAAPSRYEPAYGGWCAFAMASHDKTEANPKSFLIENGRLLVFYDGLWGNTRKQWLEKSGAKLRPSADNNWQDLSGEAPPRDVSNFLLDQGVALSGMDPISVAEGKPTEGDLELAVLHDGVTYAFANEDNRDQFLAAPEQYEPLYGGWCPTALAYGQKVAPDPAISIVENGEVLLFVSSDARDTWQQDAANLRTKADATWKALHGRR